MMIITNNKIKDIRDSLKYGWEFHTEELRQTAVNKICSDKTEPIYKNGKYSFVKSVIGDMGFIHSLCCIIYYNKYNEPTLHIISYETQFSEYSVCYGYDNLNEIKLDNRKTTIDYKYLSTFTELCTDDYIKNLDIVKEHVKELYEDYKKYKG